ncbi:acyltransferase family protein [Pseudonocardia ailaonensis]|uniref:acyltransferase family protein n=1 Tax=Pseudonocardia ailaonensis TaxID=367279 RepID=UPI0031D75CE7
MTATAEQAPQVRTGEFRALTGLRIVAAGWVVLFHFHFTALPGVAAVSDLLGPLLTNGALGVDLFFVLSGFVIAHTYLDKLGPRLRAREAGRFVWARACRIWPAYVLVFHMFGIWLVARAVYGADPEIAFQAVQPTLSVGEWLQQLFMVQLWDNSYFDGASWVGSTWSISAEWLAYLLFPLIAVVAHRMRNLPVVVLGLGAVAMMAPIALAYAATGSPYYPWSWLVRILCGFGGGVLAYLAVRRMRTSEAASRVATLTPVLIAVGLVAGEYVAPGRGGVVIVLFPVLVGALALARPTGLARLLSTPAMVHGGRISYALYLVHIPMFEVFWLAMRRYGGFGGSSLLAPGRILTHLVALAVLLSTLVAAHLLFRWVEEPARAAMKDLPAQWGVQLRASAARAERLTAKAVASTPVAELPTEVLHLTRPLAPVVVGAAVDTESARQDPDTRAFPALPPLEPELAVGIADAGPFRGGEPHRSEPAPVLPVRPAVPFPAFAAEVERPAPITPLRPVPAPAPEPLSPAAWSAPVELRPAGPQPTAAEPVRPAAFAPTPAVEPVRPAAFAPTHAAEPALPGLFPPVHATEPVGPAEFAPDHAAAERALPEPALRIPAPSEPTTGPQEPVTAAVPVQRPVERVVEARRAHVRSPHPELADELVGARGRGRHRVHRDQPHTPQIAGQRGPKTR